MKSTSHTPGPWLNGWGKVTDSDGKAICMVVHRKSGDNGSLIASAPELLAALELGLRNIEEIESNDALNEHDRAFAEAARAAIAKAKGGAK